MFETRRLGNGARILTARMRDAQSTAVYVGIAAGSRYERPEAAGIAHFAEHMFFKGTEARPTARDISAEIDGIGGEFNAFTGKEMTAYYVKCAAPDAGIAVDVLADMLLASRFDAEEIDREKGVIVEEINMYLDTPRDRVAQAFDSLRYGESPIGRPIIGTKETVQAATRDTFTSYLDEWYRPDRIVVGLGGAVSESVVGQVVDAFGSLPARESPERPATELPTFAEPAVRIDRRDSDQAHVVLGVGGLPTAHPDRYVLAVLSTVLGGGMSSRLFTEVRERRGLAYYVFAGAGSYADAGSLVVRAGVDVNRTELALETIAAELRRLVDEDVPEAELSKAKRFLIGRTILGLEDPRGVIGHGLRGEILEGEPRTVEEIREGIEAVTAADVRRLAAELVTPERTTLAAVGPFDDEAPFRASLRAIG